MKNYKTDLFFNKENEMILILIIGSTKYLYILENEYLEYNKNRINHFISWLYDIEKKHNLYIFNDDISKVMNHIDSKYFNEYLKN